MSLRFQAQKLYSTLIPVVQAGKIVMDRRKHTILAADRNKKPILDFMLKYVETNKPFFALEIASGSGQHVSFFAKSFPNIMWQPTEVEPTMMDSIDAYIDEAKLPNILRPKKIDVTQPVPNWSELRLDRQSCDIVLSINMIHITPFACAIGLFNAAGYLLKHNGMLILYGPYAVHGKLVPESNVQFDKHLKAMNSQFGVRDIDDLSKLAVDNGLTLEVIEDLPANNKAMIFRKYDS